MTHLFRKSLKYRGVERNVVSQSENKYKIIYKRKSLIVWIDPYNGSISI